MGYTESYVAFLDILGFKKIIEKSSFEEIYAIFNEIKDAKENVQIAIYRACEEEDVSLVHYNEALEETKINIMSDSIVISTPCKYKESLSAIVDICWFIQYMLYDLEEPILLRGAIAKGEMYQNGEIMFGKGMIDAYLLQEHVSIYPRIILKRELLDETEDVALMWDQRSRTLPAEDGYYYVDCLYEYLDSPNKIFVEQKGKKICDYIEKTIQENIGNERVKEKMLWLKNEYIRCVAAIESVYPTPS